MTTCPDCGHPASSHSSEPGVGCLHDVGDTESWSYFCPCLRTGTSEADQ